MSCPICENRELVEDENTGQLICSECGTATGVYRGVTQSQDFSETRGLRVIQKTEHIVSQSNQAATDNIADTSRFVKVEPDSTHDQNMNSVCREDLLNTLDDDLFSGSEVSFINPTQKEKCFERHRPWRLSEPFTFIMRRQANCLAKELNLSVEQKVSFCDTVWSIWLHYLSITGELGSDAWVNAALLLAKSISEVLESKMIPEEERPTNKILRKHKTSDHCYMTTQREHEWELMQTRLNQFQWVGWGLLYEPEEGREIAKILHLSRKKKAPKQVDKSEKSKRRGRKRKNCSESDSSELVLSDENPDDDAQSVHSPAYDDRRDMSNPDVHDSDLSFQPKAVESELFPDNDCTQEMPLSYFTKKLSRLRSMGHLFWRGQIEGGFNCRVLMEYNVAILFIACLTTCPIRKAVNPLFSSHFINSDFSNSPCALTTMITLKDLQDLCNNRRLPFISASVKLSLSQPLRNLFEPYQVNCLTESTVSTQSHCTHRHQMVIDDLTSDSSTNGKKNTFYKCLIPSDYEQDGLLSPFLNTQLDFLYNKGINVNDYIPNAFNDHQTSTDSYGFNDCTIREWWLDLINQRSDYFSICIGEWSSNSSSKSQWKNRHRSKQPLILPKPVEEFIAKHDESLSKALGHDHDELVHAKQNDKDDSQKGGNVY
ncbi:hypothetical protein Smp_164890 [Schistosoma mansoni]|uniref:hypothetical protein n=1 Tax=Schistosoma mansoni TaxID=6183 RepID=UPI00022DC8EB|nr:hypothetical protein Smp_164890 [Schistosoma mansoni]|eukprot:XP_018647773.1 hypothetical protein Smp_164890 [Schistosoma mansoni]